MSAPQYQIHSTWTASRHRLFYLLNGSFWVLDGLYKNNDRPKYRGHMGR